MTIYLDTDGKTEIVVPPGSCAVRAGTLTGPYGTTIALGMYADGCEHVAVVSPDYALALRDKLTALMDQGKREGWAWNPEAADHA